MMNRTLAGGRILELPALFLIGDGVLGLFDARRHMRLWRRGPKPYQVMMEAMIRRPALRYLMAAAEIAAGFWWASRQRAPAGK